MKVEDLKWYSPFLYLAGAILSVADPITDVLTVVEFYRNDHKTWCGVGLLFVILPCLAFAILVVVKENHPTKQDCGILCCAKTIALGLHPFAAAFARVRGLVFSFNKWRRADDEDDEDDKNGDLLLFHIDLLVLFESVLESAPQFIIQLYAINTQEEPVQIIQMISLPVSFLSLNWALVILDERSWFDEGQFTLRHKIFIFLTQFLLLSSRLFAVCYFTVTFKWWVIGVLLCHTFVIVIANTFVFRLGGPCDAVEVIVAILMAGIYWLKDDVFERNENARRNLLPVLGSNVLFVIENVVMILVFYYSQHSNSWFSLPVTVCVCSFSVFGSTMKIAGLYVFVRRQERDQ